MPLYEYRCENCDRTFEQMVAARNRDDGATCPDCGSKRVRRLISRFGIGKASLGSSSASSCPTCSSGTCSLG
ncbi:MAG: zinc ribbon domain-containing protein [Armatimonadetes bacterium]|nr:zinc ribbon domain-containing protein [Armatimonadota bacterium]